MARLPRVCISGAPHHVIQRGNNREHCFREAEDFSAYSCWLKEYASKYSVAIHAWVFMTNHVHLLATPENADGICRMMQSLGRKYVRYFNDKYQRTGTLWEGRFKSCIIDAEHYLIICQRYIELNPVRAAIVKSPEAYIWSSYQAHALGKNIEMWQPHSIYLQLASNSQDRQTAYRRLFYSHLEDEVVIQIRTMTNRGLALGDAHFKKNIEAATGLRITPRKRGPKPEEEEFLL